MENPTVFKVLHKLEMHMSRGVAKQEQSHSSFCLNVFGIIESKVQIYHTYQKNGRLFIAEGQAASCGWVLRSAKKIIGGYAIKVGQHQELLARDICFALLDLAVMLLGRTDQPGDGGLVQVAVFPQVTQSIHISSPLS